MKPNLLFFVILPIVFSCNTKERSQFEINIEEDKILEGSLGNIQLHFTAEQMIDFKETIEINASLYNNNLDTVYFLTSSCVGEQYSLRYDTTRFELSPFISCNVSYPRIVKIAPKTHHDFKAHFKCSNQETNIRLGFDFYRVDKSFEVNDKNLGDFNIFNRPKEEQTVIWSEKTEIQEK